jgi:predicted nuclease of predicted toxin-antitoxin system
VIIWLDAQLSPQLAGWMEATFGIQCRHVRDLDLHDAEDPEIFKRASNSGVVVMTKDEDFVRLVERNGSPPQVIWVTSGNMSNAHFQSLLLQTFPDAKSLIEAGETVVEISRRKP